MRSLGIFPCAALVDGPQLMSRFFRCTYSRVSAVIFGTVLGEWLLFLREDTPVGCVCSSKEKLLFAQLL